MSPTARTVVQHTSARLAMASALMFACEAGHHKAVALLCQLGEPLEIELGYALANGRNGRAVGEAAAKRAARVLEGVLAAADDGGEVEGLAPGR